MKKQSPLRWSYHATTLVLGLGGFLGACALVGADEIVIEKRVVLPVRPAVARPAVEAEDEDIKKKETGDGAALKTDPELERLLKRAEQFALEGRYDLATVLWQKVLEESGDILRTADGQIYTSMAAEVERTLGNLPPEGLKVYRISADGEAHALMATIQQGADEEEVLTKIVRRYFMSSLGDDAAYKLGCMALDRHDFVGASRMFSQILEQHPDPSMPRSELLLRAAVASARVGDTAVATQALDAVENDPGVRPPRATIASVKDYVTRADQASAAAADSHNWRMQYGNASRNGHMRSIPKSAAEADLAELWTKEFDVLLPQAKDLASYGVGRGRGGVVVAGAGGALILRSTRVANQMMQPDTRENLVNSWRQKGWFPTSQLLFENDEHGSRVYIKTATDLTCWDADRLSDAPIWRTAWSNLYQPDGGTNMIMQLNIQGYNLQMEGPRSLGEILHFGDRVHQSISICGDLIFNLEGRRVADKSIAPDVDDATPQPFGWNYGTVPRRTRRNWLAAYEARTGKAVWYRSADDVADKDASKPASDIGFLAAPTPYGNLLLTPVTDGGSVWLYALSRQDGKTVWKTFLCDEPQGGASQWATVGVAVEGREAYVCCGTGAVFAVDAVSGVIRWAVRYERSTQNDTRFQQVYGVQNMMKKPIGFQDDVVIPYGKVLIVLASDSDYIFALDRRTGELAWNSPRRDALYPLGLVGRHLFVAGRDSVRKYDAIGGRLLQDRVLNESPRQADALSYGRGCLTEDAVYLPVKDSVLKLSTKDLSDISQVGVSTVSNDPVGNLFTDGDKLWGAGASKVYALTNFERRMAELAKRIEAGDANAQLTRMRMQFTLGRVEEAIADLEGAYHLTAKTDPVAAAQLLLGSMREMQLPSSQPPTTLRLLSLAFLDSSGKAIAYEPLTDDKEALDDLRTRKAETLYTTLSAIRTQKIPGVVEPIVRLAPVMDQEYLLHTARKAVMACAVDSDVDVLAAAVRSSSPQSVYVTADALALVQGEEAQSMLQELLSADNDRIRLSAASGLLNLSDKSALPVLVALLESSDARVATQASSLLRSVSGKFVAFSPSDAELKKQGLAAWKTWLEKESADARWTTPVTDSQPLLGRTLICYFSGSKVEELDKDNNVVWSAQIQGVWSGQGLPNGHRLFALYTQRKIIELDSKGQEVWSIDNLPGAPYNARRLENGNTLVACSDGQKVIEFRRDKSIAWEVSIAGRPMDAVKLENGNLLVALSQGNRVVEFAVNERGETKEVWSADGLMGAVTVERLENGNTLVACMSGGPQGVGMVVEIDPQKNHVWKLESVRNPYDAQRLPNGNTLVTDQQMVQEVDADRKVIWKRQQNGSSSAHRF